MSGFFEICGNNIRLDSIKNYRIIQREYIYRPAYREVTTTRMKFFTNVKYEFVDMVPYAAVIDEKEYKVATANLNSNSLVEGGFNPSEAVANVVMAPINFVGDVVGNVFNTVGGWFNFNSRPKYYCLNLSGRAFETYFDEIPIVIVKDDGSVSDVFKNDEKFSKITNVAKPTIQHVDVLLIEADRKYLFFGNGIQSEDANLDYNRLKDALNAPSIFKK